MSRHQNFKLAIQIYNFKLAPKVDMSAIRNLAICDKELIAITNLK
jgi:hypothetical protein